MTALKACIANTHDDYEIYKETLVELDEKKRLVIDKFNDLIESSFNFSDLQHSNYVINARTAFEAIQSIFDKL